MTNAFGQEMGWSDLIVFVITVIVIFFSFGFRYHIVKMSMNGRKGKRKIQACRAARIKEENQRILRGELVE